MILLLVTYNVHHLVNWVVLKAEFCSTYILSHIYGCAVCTKEKLLIESVLCQISPNATILATVEVALCESALYFAFTNEVSIAFVVYLVKTYTHLFVSLVKTCIYPLVHLLPESTNLRVVLLPFYEHSLCLFDEWSLFLGGLLVHALSHELFDLSLIFHIKAYIVVADEVVTFLAAVFWSLTIAELLPCEHRLADMNTTVVHDIGLYYIPTICLLNLCDRVAKQVVAHVTEVQRFVGVWRRVFHHHERLLAFAS